MGGGGGGGTNIHNEEPAHSKSGLVCTKFLINDDIPVLVILPLTIFWYNSQIDSTMAEEEVNTDLVVKLGGSAVTHKECMEMLNSHNLAEVAILLNHCYQANRRFIVVHGAG